jgi:hypothetical protein
LTVLHPALEVLRRISGFAAWTGPDAVTEEMTRILRKAKGRSIISGDYTGFDRSLSRELLDLVDDVICEWYVEQVHPRIRNLTEYASTAGIVVPWKVLENRNGGMPSGHGLTNLKDTIANLIALFYLAYRLKVSVVDYSVMGDDFVVLFSDEISDEALSTVLSELGLTANPDKQFISTDSVHYLQRWHSLKYVVDGLCLGCHSPYRTEVGLHGYEVLKDPRLWSEDMDTTRWIMQVEVCAEDPRHAAVCSYLHKRDRVLNRGDDPWDVLKRAGGPDKVRSTLGIVSFPFIAKNPERLNEFKTTAVIRSLQR